MFISVYLPIGMFFVFLIFNLLFRWDTLKNKAIEDERRKYEKRYGRSRGIKKTYEEKEENKEVQSEN